MAEEETQEQRPQLDDRVQRVLNVIAYHIGSFHLDGRTGELTFTICFKKGELYEDGFVQNIQEHVL